MRERDEKAEAFYTDVNQEAFPTLLDAYKSGWDAALESEAVRGLVEALRLTNGKLNRAGVRFTHAEQVLEQFNKAKSQGDGG